MSHIEKRVIAGGIRAALLLALSLLLAAPAPAYAAGRDEGPLRVGYLAHTDIFSPCGYHAHSGYGYEYLQELAQYTGWEYTFVPLSSWQEGFVLLEGDGLDLLAAVPKGPRSLRYCAFPSLGMGLSYATLLAKAADGRYAFEDFAAFDGMRVGVIAGGGMDARLKAYGREEGFEATAVQFDSLEAMEDALEQGRVDALLTASLHTPGDLKMIAKFTPRDIYFATAKADTATLAALEEGLRRIQQQNPYFNAALSEKYYDCQALPMVGLTREELDYVKSCGPIPVACQMDSPPFCYFDEDKQAFGGAAIALLNYIAGETGLSFSFLPAAQAPEAALQAVRTRDFMAAKEEGLFLTCGYVSSQLALAARDGLGGAPVLAVPAGFGEAEAVEEIRRKAGGTISYYASDTDCLDAVHTGAADAAVGSAKALDYYLNNYPKYKNIRLIQQGTDSVDYCFSVSRETDRRLISILDKAIASCPNAELEYMLMDSMMAQGRHSLLNYIYANPLQVIGIIGGSLLAVLAAVGLLLLIRDRNARRMKALIYTDPLTGHGNYKTLCEAAPKLMQADPAGYALLYMDAYQFKFINDTFG